MVIIMLVCTYSFSGNKEGCDTLLNQDEGKHTITKQRNDSHANKSTKTSSIRLKIARKMRGAMNSSVFIDFIHILSNITKQTPCSIVFIDM